MTITITAQYRNDKSSFLNVNVKEISRNRRRVDMERRPRGRPSKKRVSPIKQQELVFVDTVRVSPPPKTRRGRPPKKRGLPDDETASSKEMKVTCFSLPVTVEDDEEVICKMCMERMTRRHFRIHSMQEHYNIATTVDDTTIPEHKFYERKLKELAKFTKIKIFQCPTPKCVSSYKSTLGLAYHLELCGKSKEEREMCFTECDVCGLKFNLPNLKWHKKNHHKDPEAEEVPIYRSTDILRLKSNRKSALKTRDTFVEDEDEEDDGKIKKKSKKKNQDFILPRDSFDIEFVRREGVGSSAICSKPTTGPKTDFNVGAAAFLGSKGNINAADFWSMPERITRDIFQNISENSFTTPLKVAEYLPSQKKSVTFQTICQSSESQEFETCYTKEFRRLNWFESEVIDNEDGNMVFNCGGPVMGLSWHPSGKLIAISTGKHSFEDIDYRIPLQRKSCVQIYSHHFKKNLKKVYPVHFLMSQLVLCSDHGYVTHLQWGNFCPDPWDNFDLDEATFSSSDKNARIGYLACSFEDGVIRIYLIRVNDFCMAKNFKCGSSQSPSIPVYKKVPEIWLEIDKVTYQNAGQACKFDWHEGNRFLIAGYCSGVVAVFDLQTVSTLLLTKTTKGGSTATVINPFWTFQAHLGPIVGVNFDPCSSRYFVTTSKDRNFKLWDMQLRHELECRKIGLPTESCWIRGFVNIAVAVDACVANTAPPNNYVRFFQMGTTQSKTNCAEFSDVSALSFHEGITLQGTEYGSVTSTYFDNFWRELDFDRNKKKNNVVNICKLSLDTSSFDSLTEDPLSASCMADTNSSSKQVSSPRIVLTFLKERVKSAMQEYPPQVVENNTRFLPITRINKISWCPSGRFFAVGFRNGLVTVIPASFDTLYA